jgi:L-amino acid N-acyltransferase YncA
VKQHWEGRLVQALAIRSGSINDAPSIQSIYAPIVSDTTISFEEVPPSTEEIAARIEKTLQSFPYLVAETSGQVIGFAYAGQHRARPAYRWSAEVTVYVAERARGHGVGRALYGALLPTLSEAGFHAAFAGIALPNAASTALHKSMGFDFVGVFREIGYKFGRWHDVAWWQRLLEDG